MRDTAYLARVALSSTAILLALISERAQAQQLKLTFDSKCVSVVAQDVTAGEVLGEWARLGATKVVNAHLLDAERLSLQLDCVPEAEAIERVLESADGFMVRRRSDAAGASGFALIVVFAARNVPARAATESNANAAREQSHVEPPPLAPSAEAASSAPPTNSDAKADSNIFSNEATGRAPGSRPVHGHVVVRAPAPVSAEKLPAGRPEDSRPGTPSATTPERGAQAPRVAAPGGESLDVNGRPVRTPKPPPFNF
jgi:hypothetical protein